MTADRDTLPVKVRALVADPKTLAVLWMNEAASSSLSSRNGEAADGATVEQVLPLAGDMGLTRALLTVAETGEPCHMSADVISTARGSMTLSVSAYRLPDGMLLVLAEDVWRSAGAASGRGTPRKDRTTRR